MSFAFHLSVSLSLKVLFILSYFASWKTRKTSILPDICKFGGFDLIITDLPKGMSFPSILSPLNAISSWNEHYPKDIEVLFEIAYDFLIDDAPLLLFFP